MNELITSQIKMTSLDLSELTGKRHADVMRDIRNEIKELGAEIGQRIFAQTSRKDSFNREQPCYTFGKDGAMQLALKYDAQIRYKVIKRIEELENNKPKSQLEILQASINQLVEQDKRINSLEGQVNNMRLVVDNEVWLTEHQKADLRTAVNRRVKELNLDGYKHAHYQTIYGALKHHFGVAKYDKIPRKHFTRALNIVKGFYPPKIQNEMSL